MKISNTKFLQFNRQADGEEHSQGGGGARIQRDGT